MLQMQTKLDEAVKCRKWKRGKEMINIAVIAGRLTKDVELAKTQNGNSVAKFTVAVNGYNDTTDFINCVAWNKLADIVNMYCKKGDLVTVEEESVLEIMKTNKDRKFISLKWWLATCNCHLKTFLMGKISVLM